GQHLGVDQMPLAVVEHEVEAGQAPAHVEPGHVHGVVVIPERRGNPRRVELTAAHPGEPVGLRRPRRDVGGEIVARSSGEDVKVWIAVRMGWAVRAVKMNRRLVVVVSAVHRAPIATERVEVSDYDGSPETRDEGRPGGPPGTGRPVRVAIREYRRVRAARHES